MEDTMFVIVTKAEAGNWYKVGDVVEVYCEAKPENPPCNSFYPATAGSGSWGIEAEDCEKVSSTALKSHIDFLNSQVAEVQEAYDKMKEIEGACYIIMKYEWAKRGKTVEPVSVHETYAEAEAVIIVNDECKDTYITYKIVRSTLK